MLIMMFPPFIGPLSRSLIQVPFLNLMSNIVARTGHVKVRVGGNSQEEATLVDSLDNGKILEKQVSVRQ
jgi:hypothetical protein